MRLTYTITSEQFDDIVVAAETEGDTIELEVYDSDGDAAEVELNVKQARELREALDFLLERITPKGISAVTIGAGSIRPFALN